MPPNIYDAVTSETKRLTWSEWRQNVVSYAAKTLETYFDISNLRTRLTNNPLYVLLSRKATSDQWTPTPSTFTTKRIETRYGEWSEWYKGAKYDAKTKLPEGMYTERDRTPRIGVHQTISGYGIANANILITGKLGQTTAAKTDGRGVWYKYLPKDDYSNADIKSFTESGKVYELLTQTERLPDEPYIWDEVMSRKTGNKAGFMMISKEV